MSAPFGVSTFRQPWFFTEGEGIALNQDGGDNRTLTINSVANSRTVMDPAFGAVGDGVADDGAALNRAADWLRTEVAAGRRAALDFLDRTYITTIPLNFTNIRRTKGETFIIGSGAIVTGKCPDEPIFDLLGSNHWHVKGIVADGDPILTPRSGFQYGRYKLLGAPGTTKAQTSAFTTFTDCGSTGSFLHGGEYNNSGEIHKEYDCQWENDLATDIPAEGVLVSSSEVIGVPYAAVFDSGNKWNVQSRYLTVTQPVNAENSFLNQQFFGTTFRRDNGGPAIYMTTAQSRVRMVGCYAVCLNGDAMVILCPRQNGGASFRRTARLWNLDLHTEADTADDPTLTYKNTFRIIPQDDNGGTAIDINFENSVIEENNCNADESVFRASDLFPTGSSIRFVNSKIIINGFHGSASTEDGGPPSLGIFYPGVKFRIAAKDLLIGAASGAPSIADTNFYLTGDYFQKSPTATNSRFPKGSYRLGNILDDGQEFYKGEHIDYGDKDVAYTGDDFPPTHYISRHKGRLGFSGGPILEHGTGSPEGVVTAAVNSVYIQTDASLGSTLWFKSTGTGNTGWEMNYRIGNATATGTQELILKAAAGNSRRIRWFTGTSQRWTLSANTTAETGNGAGSNLAATAFTDAGLTSGTLFTGARTSGPVGSGGPEFSVLAPWHMTQNKATTPLGSVGTWVDIDDVQPTVTLGANPIATTSGSPNVVITWTANGLGTTSDVLIAGATAVGGLTLSGWYRITAKATNTITVNVGSNASSTATGGGAAVTARPGIPCQATRVGFTIKSSANGFSNGGTSYIEALPDYYWSTASGVNGPDFEGNFLQLLGPSDNSQLNAWTITALEYNLVNRGADEGYQPDQFTASRSSTGMKLVPENNVNFGGNEGQNCSTAYRVGRNVHPNATGYFCKWYQGLHVGPNSIVSQTAGVGGRGGTGVDIFGAYVSLGVNPIATTNGSATVTITVPASTLLITGHNTPASVYFLSAVTVNSCTIAAGSHAITVLSETQFTLVGTGAASATGSGGTVPWVAFNTDIPYAPAEITGEWAHGIRTNKGIFDDGYALFLGNTQSIGWRNAADAADLTVLTVDSSNSLVVGAPIKSGFGTTTAAGTGGTSTATLNTMGGIITTDAITTAAGASHVMTVTNSKVAAGDAVGVWRESSGTNTRKIWALSSTVTGASTFTVTIDNNELANAINGTVKFIFQVLKAN